METRSVKFGDDLFMIGIGALPLQNSLNNLNSSISSINEQLSNLTFEDITGILPLNKGGTGTAEKSMIPVNIGLQTGSSFPTNIYVPTDYATIQEAINSIPKFLTQTVYINIAAGTYTENLTIAGFHGPGSLYIRGNDAEVVTLNGKVSISDNTTCIYLQSRTAPGSDTSTTPYFRIQGPALSSGTAYIISVANTMYVSLQYLQIRGVARADTDVYYHGVNSAYGSNVYINACRFRRCYYCARATYNSTLSMTNCVGGVTSGTAVSSSNEQNSYVARSDRSSVYLYGKVPSAASTTLPNISYGGYGGASSTTFTTAFS